MHVQGVSLKIAANLLLTGFFDSPATNFISGIFAMAGEAVRMFRGVHRP